jgi:hypothetical protein
MLGLEIKSNRFGSRSLDQAPSESAKVTTGVSASVDRRLLNQSTPGEASHQLADPEIPGGAIVGMPHPIGKSAEFV